MFAGYMTNAWIAGTIVAAVTATIGFFAVSRHQTFAAHAIPHGSFAGAAASILLGVNLYFGLSVFSLIAAGLVALGARRGRSDAATAVSLAGFLALGAAMLSWSSSYDSAVTSLLFGQILGVSRGQIAIVASVGAAAVVFVTTNFRPLLYSTVAPGIARTSGVRTGLLDGGFLIAMALVATLAVPVVGALLAFTLMIAPAAAVRLIEPRPLRALALTVTISLLTMWISIAGAFVTDWPVGFFVGMVGATSYAVARLIARRLVSDPGQQVVLAH